MPTDFKYLIAIFFVILSYTVRGQGCSDAGFCTLESFKPRVDTTTVRWRLKIGANAGAADHAINVFGGYVELNKRFSKSVSADVKLTALSQSGNGVSAFGLSDLFLNTKYQVADLALTVGTKLPLADGNKMIDNLGLPMDYQSSLGTFDLILGASYTFRKLQFNWAYQQPLTQNKNTFLADEYPPDSPLTTFQSTNQFQRKADMLIRVSYPVRMAKNLMLTPSLLPIYHMGNDQFVNALGEDQVIKDSKGLTLNANLYADLIINNSSAIQVSAAVPLIVREARPDGLTRSFVINVEYAIKF